MPIEELKIPAKALEFIDHGEGTVEFIDEEFATDKGTTEKRPSANIIGYSGGVLEHWYWGRVGINTSGIKFKKSAYPVLDSHDLSRKIGFSKRPTISEGKLICNKKDVTLLDTEAAQEFIKLGRQGFPFEASIAIQPTTIKRFDKPTDVALNGKVLKNLDVVFDASIYKEVSVCVFGADPETQSVVENAQRDLITFTVDSEKVGFIDTQTGKPNESEVTKMPKIEMTLEQFKADYPELVEALTAEFKASATKTIDGLSVQVTELTTAFKDMGTKFATLIAENDALKTQRAEFLAKEQKKAEQDSVDAVWTEAFTAETCKVPVELHDKIKLLVRKESFTKDDILDIEAFKAAVDAEIKDWEAKGFTTSSVQGFGSSTPPVKLDDTKKTIKDTAKSLARFISKDMLKTEKASA